MADFNEKFKVVMLQGAKGETYDDTQLRQDINEMLANVPYIKYTEDNGFELPIYTINDNNITAYSCWSSDKVNSEITSIKEDITTIENELANIHGFGYVLKNPKLVHITKDALLGFSSAETLIATISASEPEAYAYFQAYDEYVGGDFSNIAVPYNWNFTNTSYSDATERHDINAMEFILGDLKINKDGNNYKLYLEWAYKSGTSFTLTNGIYLHVYPFFRPLPTNE